MPSLFDFLIRITRKKWMIGGIEYNVVMIDFRLGLETYTKQKW